MFIYERAAYYAMGAHSAIGQTRKYTNVPYHWHSQAVAGLVRVADGTDEMIAAAWLHDVVEDTKCTLLEIEQLFGSTVALYVRAVTDISKPEDGNRAARKLIDKNHVRNACAEAKTIKLADLINNTESILRYDPKFAKIYMKEKKDLLSVLTEGNTMLLNKAWEIMNGYEKKVANDEQEKNI